MKAAIISQGSTSSTWTYEAMQKYFDEVDELDITKIEVNISNKPQIQSRVYLVVLYFFIHYVR